MLFALVDEADAPARTGLDGVELYVEPRVAIGIAEVKMAVP
jgi:hypothetical protein